MNEQDYKTNQTTNAIQKDLENQLNMFKTSVVDGVINGFEGRGEEIGNRAKNVAHSVVRAVEHEAKQTMPKQWSFRMQKKPSYVLEKSASSRSNVGVLQVVFGAVFGLTLMFSGAITLLAGLAVSGVAGAGVVLGAGIQLAIGAPLTWMFICGLDNNKLAKRMKRYVLALDDVASISLQDLAEASGYSLASVKKDIKKLMKNDWCQLWLNASETELYLSVDAYRAAKEQEKTARATAQNKAAQAGGAAEATLLQSISNFIDVLGKQTEIMQEADAIEELGRMQETCRDIYDWLGTHPEAEPKLRRFTSYYMPTTLKLLYSYNDVQGQQGENAQTIRRDIGRFLHTLNTAFDNLHDNLLSSVSLDVSSEIAALQGMLAQDGLSQADDFGAVVNLEL